MIPAVLTFAEALARIPDPQRIEECPWCDGTRRIGYGRIGPEDYRHSEPCDECGGERPGVALEVT